MNRNHFYHYLENIEKLDNESLVHLKELVAEYPFFQAGRMMLVKNLHLLDDIKYQYELKQASVHIADRRKLFLLVHSGGPAEVLGDEVVEKPVEDVPKQDVVESREEEVSSDPSENYFGVTDEVETTIDDTINFSAPEYNVGKQQPEAVLPEPQWLDYERAAPNSTYKLEEEEVDPAKDRSFIEWLNAMNLPHKLPQEQAKEEEAPQSHQMDLIDSFLKLGQDRIVPKEEKEIGNVDVSRFGIEEKEELMTETLANIHIKQKHYEKAIIIFEKLSLKYPEKNIYFATRIKEIEKLINKQ